MEIWRKPIVKMALALAATLLVTTTAFAVGGGGLWLSAGHDLNNTRNQKTEAKIGPENVGNLGVKWVVNNGADVSATPAVDGEAVYFPDWAGNLFKVDRETGAVIWSRSIAADYTGVPGNFARTTPAVYEDMLFFGDQGGRLGAGARMMAVDKNTGDLIWITSVGNGHPFAIVTQSATVFDGVVYVGVASFEELYAEVIPGYQCCSFRGSMMALDAYTGELIWETFTASVTGATPDYSGNAVWGSAPVVDTKRNTVYVATGNNYSVPDSFLNCIAAAGDDRDAQFACLDEGNYFDAVVAFDMDTGAVKWSTVVIPFDAWTVACLFGEFSENPQNCPDPEGPDFDFGQAPILYRVQDNGRQKDLLGVGQKSGVFWALDADTGEIVWSTQAGPGGVAGGIMWGSAYDGERLYTSIANSQGKAWTLIDGSTTNGGGWAALDPATGEILWQTANPQNTIASGAVTVANGVVYGCSMDFEGHMYAMDAATGAILWGFASGGSCNAGAAVVNGTVYWGSGYASFGGTPNDQFYAFELAQ